MENRTYARRNLPLIAALCVVMCLFLGVWKDTSFALDGADVAIYNDSIAPADPDGTKRSGAWQDGITAIKCMLTWMGFSYEEITYRDLNDSTQNLSSLYKVLLFPGGFAYWYNYWISLSGKARIRNFVNNGGGYFGICAGSFFASDTVVWEGVIYDDNSLYNAYGELTGYDLDLFPGTGTGPINGIAPWPTYEMTTVNFQNETAILSSYKTVPFSEDILYYGGPYFTTDQGADVVALGNYEYNGKPALVAFTYGSGRVVLTGPHPEIEEDSDRDCVTIDREDEMNDQGSDWELALHLFNWIISSQPSCPDLYSWNGEEYVNNSYIFSRCHCPESEYYQERLVTQPVEVAQYNDNMLNFKIKEVDDEVSYINSVAMYYRNNDNEWTELDLLSAVHNSAGDVNEALKDKDDERVYTVPGDEILLTYLAPSGGVEGAEFKSISSGYYLWSAETWCEVLELGPDLNIHPGDTVTFSAKINNMSAYELPEGAVVYFSIHSPELYAVKVVSVPAAGLAPGSPEWYSCNWTVPADFPSGNFPYKASIYIGETDITWIAPPDQSNDSDTSGDERKVTSVGSSCD